MIYMTDLALVDGIAWYLYLWRADFLKRIIKIGFEFL